MVQKTVHPHMQALFEDHERLQIAFENADSDEI
jgi:hypothetical protein